MLSLRGIAACSSRYGNGQSTCCYFPPARGRPSQHSCTLNPHYRFYRHPARTLFHRTYFAIEFYLICRASAIYPQNGGDIHAARAPDRPCLFQEHPAGIIFTEPLNNKRKQPMQDGTKKENRRQAASEQLLPPYRQKECSNWPPHVRNLQTLLRTCFLPD